MLLFKCILVMLRRNEFNAKLQTKEVYRRYYEAELQKLIISYRAGTLALLSNLKVIAVMNISVLLLAMMI